MINRKSKQIRKAYMLRKDVPITGDDGLKVKKVKFFVIKNVLLKICSMWNKNTELSKFQHERKHQNLNLR